MITGGPGVGKTTLLDAFLRLLVVDETSMVDVVLLMLHDDVARQAPQPERADPSP